MSSFKLKFSYTKIANLFFQWEKRATYRKSVGFAIATVMMWLEKSKM
ncbi:hypothetical protein [Gallibacterium anatis]|nr:hypothetical protein [Gallibacterium anatis]